MPLVANEEEDNVMLISGTAAPESSSSTWTRAYGIRLAQQRGLVQSHDQIHLLDERRRRKRSDADVKNAQASNMNMEKVKKILVANRGEICAYGLDCRKWNDIAQVLHFLAQH